MQNFLFLLLMSLSRAEVFPPGFRGKETARAPVLRRRAVRVGMLRDSEFLLIVEGHHACRCVAGRLAVDCFPGDAFMKESFFNPFVRKTYISCSLVKYVYLFVSSP